jgi:uncharacterized membrane protein
VNEEAEEHSGEETEEEEFPKAEIKRYQRVIYGIILAISLIWCGGILVAPLWAESGGVLGAVSGFFYKFYSYSCHQIPERSYYLGEHVFGVCSRCTAIYLAFLIGVIIYPFVRRLSDIDLPSLFYLFIGVGALGIDVGLDMLDIHKNTFITRDISGFIIGIVLPFYIIPGTIRVFYEFFTPQDVIDEQREDKTLGNK